MTPPPASAHGAPNTTSRRATVAATRVPPPAKRAAGPVLTSLAALSLLVAGAVVGAAVFLHADGRPPSALLDAVRPHLARVQDLVADARAAFTKQTLPDRPKGGDASGEASGATTGRDSTKGSDNGTPTGNAAATTGDARGTAGGGTGAASGRDTGATAPGTGAGTTTGPGARDNGVGVTGSSRDATDGAGAAGADPNAATGAARRTTEAGSPSSAPSGGALASPSSEGHSAGATSGLPAPLLPPAGADSGSSLPGQMVVALDVSQKPVFSPSFAADGSAVFFDEDSGTGGSALKEARTGSDNLLRVLSVLDDGARNYHPQLSPDGTTVAFDSDRDGVRGVYLSNRAGENIRRVSGDGYAAVPTWSPDGRRLAFIKAEPGNARVWNVWTLDVTSGAMRRLTAHRFGQPWGASWFPDGRRICYSHEDQLIVLDTYSGASRVYPSPRKGTLVRTPAVSPDGRQVIFQLYRHGAWLLDLDDGSMRQVLDDPSAEEFAWSPDGSRVAFHSRRQRQWGLRVMTPSARR